MREILGVLADEAGKPEPFELWAPRRRGVRQGRRVHVRAVREFLKRHRDGERVIAKLVAFSKQQRSE
jgi:hypothetical protein